MAENCEKLATESQSQSRWSGGGGVDLQELGALVVDDFLREAQAGAALHVAAEMGIGRLRTGRAGAGRLADLVLAERIADAHDHDSECTAIARRSQVGDSTELAAELLADEWSPSHCCAIGRSEHGAVKLLCRGEEMGRWQSARLTAESYASAASAPISLGKKP